jgi:hypothetical protein
MCENVCSSVRVGGVWGGRRVGGWVGSRRRGYHAPGVWPGMHDSKWSEGSIHEASSDASCCLVQCTLLHCTGQQLAPAQWPGLCSCGHIVMLCMYCSSSQATLSTFTHPCV